MQLDKFIRQKWIEGNKNKKKIIQKAIKNENTIQRIAINHQESDEILLWVILLASQIRHRTYPKVETTGLYT